MTPWLNPAVIPNAIWVDSLRFTVYCAVGGVVWCGVAYCVVSSRHNFRHYVSFPFFLVVIHCPVTVNRSRAHVSVLLCFHGASVLPLCHRAIVPLWSLCGFVLPSWFCALFCATAPSSSSFFFFQCFVFRCFRASIHLSFVIHRLSFGTEYFTRVWFVPFAVPELSLLWSVSGGLCARFRTTEKLPNSQTPELGKLEGTEPSIPPSNWAATTRHKTRKKISQKMDEYKIRQKMSQK